MIVIYKQEFKEKYSVVLYADSKRCWIGVEDVSNQYWNVFALRFGFLGLFLDFIVAKEEVRK